MRTERSYDPFRLLALTIPAIEAAVGKNWLPTLILTLLCASFCTWMSSAHQPSWKWLRYLQNLGAALLLSGFLGWTHTSWPGEGADYVIPGVLLLLAAYAVWRGSAIRAASVLRYGVYLILLVLALPGLRNLRLSQLAPKAELPSMSLAAALLLPLLGRREKNWKFIPNGFCAVAASLLTVGSVSLFEYSRGVSLGSAAEHLESLAACAAAVCWFAFLCYVLDSTKDGEEKPNGVWAVAAIAYGMYAFGIQLSSEILVLLELLLWAVAPGLYGIWEKMTKSEKSA